jgi:chromate transporter
MEKRIERGRLRELVLLFTKLGIVGFGGPAAHIALMHDEVVVRREWMDEQHFLDLVGATNLIPGPNSTELAIHIGRERAGWKGLVVAGTAFILPAMLIVLALAWLYVRFGSQPSAEAVLYGIAPVVIAIIAQAVWQLGRKAARGPALLVISIAVFALYLAGVNELLLLAAAALLAGSTHVRRPSAGLIVAFPPVLAAAGGTVSLTGLFLLFLKFGSVVFGSGYVLFAFLRGDLVTRLGWITSEQLIDAISIGQLTPGPVFTTATFIGYLVAGFPGALIATAGIFTPSFIFVSILNPLMTKIRARPALGAALDGLNAAAIGLMAGVMVQFARVALIDWLTIALVVVATFVIIRWRPNAAWLILAGAGIGVSHEILA